jgi:hypothetical protein
MCPMASVAERLFSAGGKSEEAPLEKLLHVAQVLGAVPSVVTPEVCCG